MPNPIPACFRAGDEAGFPPPRPPARPALSTSLYKTHLGFVSLTWSQDLLGLSIYAELKEEVAEEDGILCFHLRPWIFWKRRGSKQFQIKLGCKSSKMEFTWDLTKARFNPSGGPEPVSGFYVSLSIDREMLLVAGDLVEEAYKRTSMHRNGGDAAVLVSRKDHVVMRDSVYKTLARFGGVEKEISIRLGSEKGMAVAVDGDRVLRVRRLRWKFRGFEKVEMESGGRIQVSWDLHDWVFGRCDEPLGERDEKPHARFVFKFEKERGGEWHPWENKGIAWGYFGKAGWSESSSGGDSSRRKKGGLLMSSSSTTSSTTSSMTSSTVTEWTSVEEVEMQRGEAFSLLVNVWRRR